jgi:hypothetical protein
MRKALYIRRIKLRNRKRMLKWSRIKAGLKEKLKRLMFELKMRSFKIFRKAMQKSIERKIKAMFKRKERGKDSLFLLDGRAFLV